MPDIKIEPRYPGWLPLIPVLACAVGVVLGYYGEHKTRPAPPCRDEAAELQFGDVHACSHVKHKMQMSGQSVLCSCQP